MDKPTIGKNRSLWALAGLNFFLADVQGGVGPFLVVFLTARQHWNPDRIGLLMGISGIVAVVAQLPAGAIIDEARHKRWIVAGAATAIGVAGLCIAMLPTFAVVLSAQSFIAVAGAVFGPAIAAITLGIVGRANLDRQIGRNQSINSSGNIVNALMAGLVGAWWNGLGLFYYVAAISCTTVASVLSIRGDDIDYAVSRGADQLAGKSDAEDIGKAKVEANGVNVLTLLQDRRILIFAISCILFHFANAGMAPLVSELLAKGAGMKNALRFTSATIIVMQLVIVPLGLFVGARAATSSRKPLYLVPFCILPLRAILYTVSHNAYFLISISALDGAAMGIFGIMQLLVIADLTRGTGRFNLTQGALGTAVGLGASSSNFLVGALVKHFGFDAGFIAMALLAVVALLFFWFAMPETKPGVTAAPARPVGLAAA